MLQPHKSKYLIINEGIKIINRENSQNWRTFQKRIYDISINKK